MRPGAAAPFALATGLWLGVMGCELRQAPLPEPKAAPAATQPTALRGAVVVDAAAMRPVADTAPPETAWSMTERGFANEAANAGLYEVAGAQMAAAKASAPDVRAFGKLLVERQLAAQDELLRLAGAHGLVLPNEVESTERAKLDRLARLKGPAFDREFVQTVGVNDRQATIARFSAARRSVRDPELVAWIDRTLPELQRQLQQAQTLVATR